MRRVKILGLGAALILWGCVDPKAEETGDSGNGQETGLTETGEPGETGETGSPDTQDTASADVRGCNSDWKNTEGDLEAPEVDASDPNGNTYRRVVTLDTDDFAPLCVAIYYPVDPEMRPYDDGAVVGVTVGPAFKDNGTKSLLAVRYGIVEVRPVYPGARVNSNGGKSCATSGEHDGGGDATILAIQETIRFAAGEGVTSDGHSLSNLVGMDICNAQVSVIGSSSGGITAAEAIGTLPEDDRDLVIGATFHETPPIGQFVNGDAGWSWMDPDLDRDGDGDGHVANDARNQTYSPGACNDGTDCALDYRKIRYTENVMMSDILPDVHVSGVNDGGILFLDLFNAENDIDGLNLREPDCVTDETLECSLDVNQNDALDEDFLLWPNSLTDTKGMSGKFIYTPQALQAGINYAFEDGEVPSHFLELKDAEVFWARRNMLNWADEVGEAYADREFPIQFTFTSIDHAVAVETHPHIRMQYEVFRSNGLNTQYNAPEDLARCLLGDTPITNWLGELEPEADIAEVDADNEPYLHQWAYPELERDGTGLDNDHARTTGIMSPFWRNWGAFERCRGSAD